jgi:hypothetical protein
MAYTDKDYTIFREQISGKVETGPHHVEPPGVEAAFVDGIG